MISQSRFDSVVYEHYWYFCWGYWTVPHSDAQFIAFILDDYFLRSKNVLCGPNRFDCIWIFFCIQFQKKRKKSNSFNEIFSVCIANALLEWMLDLCNGVVKILNLGNKIDLIPASLSLFLIIVIVHSTRTPQKWLISIKKSIRTDYYLIEANRFRWEDGKFKKFSKNTLDWSLFKPKIKRNRKELPKFFNRFRERPSWNRKGKKPKKKEKEEKEFFSCLLLSVLLFTVFFPGQIKFHSERFRKEIKKTNSFEFFLSFLSRPLIVSILSITISFQIYSNNRFNVFSKV